MTPQWQWQPGCTHVPGLEACLCEFYLSVPSSEKCWGYFWCGSSSLPGKKSAERERPQLLPVGYLSTLLLPSGAHLFWAIPKVTYQHLPRSLRLPFKTGFDVTDSHIATFLKEGGMEAASVKSVLSLRIQHLPRDN